MPFNQIPGSNLLTPWGFIEFSNVRALNSTGITYKGLVIGQKLSSGTATAEVPVKVTSVDQAKVLFGAGSMLARMVEKLRKNNKFTEFICIPLADDAGGVKATGTLTVTGPATKAGTLYAYIGNQRFTVSVSSGDSANTIAAALNTAINAQADLAATSTVSTNVVTVTHRHKGAFGNYLDMRFNYNDGEKFPDGVSVAIVAMNSGTANPSVAGAITAMAEIQYHVIAFPYTDSANLVLIEAEMERRWGPLTQIDGVCLSALSDSHSNLGTFGDARNSKFMSIQGWYKSPTPVEEIAAALAGVVAYDGNIDPARPFTTLPVVGVGAPAPIDRFSLEERNLLLLDGISTLDVDNGGVVRIERLITNYKTNEFSAVDPSYRNLNTILTLSYLRYDQRNYFLRKYPRSKLADDGTQFAEGQAIVTPKIIKAELVTLFRTWEEKGLVENIDQFIEDLIVERDVDDQDRVNVISSPDLVNQLLVMGTQIAFIL